MHVACHTIAAMLYSTAELKCVTGQLPPQENCSPPYCIHIPNTSGTLPDNAVKLGPLWSMVKKCCKKQLNTVSLLTARTCNAHSKSYACLVCALSVSGLCNMSCIFHRGPGPNLATFID